MPNVKRLQNVLKTVEKLEADLQSELTMATIDTDKSTIRAALNDMREIRAGLSRRISETNASKLQYGKEH